VTDRVLKEATMKPAEKFNKVQNGLETILGGNEARKHCEDWGFTVDHELIRLNAHIIPAPQVIYSGAPVNASSGSWNLRGKRFTFVPHEISQWCVVNFSGDMRGVNEFIDTLIRTSGTSGTSYNHPLLPKDWNSVKDTRRLFKQG